jgi:hypothetical protein
MAAATMDRNTPIARLERLKGGYALGTNVTVYAGTIAAVAAATGLVATAGDTAGQRVVGYHLRQASSLAANVAAGFPTVPEVGAGEVWLANGGNITAAHLGQTAYMLDDQTVGLVGDATNDIKVGIIEQVDATLGVLVSIDNGHSLPA